MCLLTQRILFHFHLWNDHGSLRPYGEQGPKGQKDRCLLLRQNARYMDADLRPFDAGKGSGVHKNDRGRNSRSHRQGATAETNGRMSPATPTLIAELFGQPL